MKCPFCEKKETKVVDKRDIDTSTRRRRECLTCQKRFTTYEKIENLNLTVLKKDDTRERFDKEKLLIGIKKACEKRPIPIEKLEQVTDKIEANLLQLKRTNYGIVLIAFVDFSLIAKV